MGEEGTCTSQPISGGRALTSCASHGRNATAGTGRHTWGRSWVNWESWDELRSVLVGQVWIFRTGEGMCCVPASSRSN